MSNLPKYKFEVGKQLSYRMTDDSHDTAAPAAGGQLGLEWDFHVMARHASGHFRVAFSECREPQDSSESAASSLGSFCNDGYFDIADDGRFVENWTITPLANPTPIFPRLPSDRSQCDTGWNSVLELDGTCRKYRSEPSDLAADSSIWPFVEECHTQLDPVYLASRERRYAFDVHQGLVTEVATNFQRGWPLRFGANASTNSIRLVDVRRSTSADLVPALSQADWYFEACAEYQRLVDLSLWDLRRSTKWLDEAVAVLERFRPQATVEFVRRMLDHKLALHRRERESLLADADKFAEIVDRPATEWQAVDLDGQPHRGIEYLGRVVILCFWNRGCPWSIRALLMLSALAAELHGRAVAFLGINADRLLDDAAFVARVLRLKFPTVMDAADEHSIASRFGIDSFPTTVVIDPRGIVRRVRLGCSRNLSTHIADEIHHLTRNDAYVQQ